MPIMRTQKDIVEYIKTFTTNNDWLSNISMLVKFMDYSTARELHLLSEGFPEEKWNPCKLEITDENIIAYTAEVLIKDIENWYRYPNHLRIIIFNRYDTMIWLLDNQFINSLWQHHTRNSITTNNLDRFYQDRLYTLINSFIKDYNEIDRLRQILNDVYNASPFAIGINE